MAGLGLAADCFLIFQKTYCLTRRAVNREGHIVIIIIIIIMQEIYKAPILWLKELNNTD